MKRDRANRFKQFKLEKRCEYSEIAKDFDDFSEQQIKDMANGVKNITPEIALLFEEKYFLNASWLIFGRGEMYLPKIDLGNEESKSLTNKQILERLEKRDKDFEDVKKELEELKKKL